MYFRIGRPTPDTAQVLQGIGRVVGIEPGLALEISLQRVTLVPFQTTAGAAIAGGVVDELHAGELHVNAAQPGRLGVADFVAHGRLQGQGVKQGRQLIMGIKAVKSGAETEEGARPHRLNALIELDAGAAGALLAEGGEL